MSKLKKAMEKAKKDRKADGESVIKEKPDSTPGSKQDFNAQPSKDNVVNPDYQQTKTSEFNPDILRQSKIISLFQEEAMADQIKILRTQVLNRMKELGGNSLLITSANPGEGKTLTSINLAISISYKLDQTILLVDSDLRKPSIHEFFGIDIHRGLSDYLAGQAEIPDLLFNPGIKKLVVLPGHKPMLNSAEMLGSPRMEALVEEMKGRYPDRFIIFDSSSLLTSADPLVFSHFIDAVLLVVEAEKTSSREIAQVMELLKGKTIIGTVLNKALN